MNDWIKEESELKNEVDKTYIKNSKTQNDYFKFQEAISSVSCSIGRFWYHSIIVKDSADTTFATWIIVSKWYLIFRVKANLLVLLQKKIL